MSYHERRSIRLKNYDYRSSAIYFITICTNHKDMIFGKIKTGKMILNDFGIIARMEWIRTARIRTYVELDAFIIMPDHVHGIIAIKSRGMASHAHDSLPQDTHTHLTHNIMINRQFGKPIKHSLSTIIGAYKSSVTREINRLRNRPGQIVWQRNFFEHIIRNEKELFATRKYVIENPGRFKY